jgi:hypothetical protein
VIRGSLREIAAAFAVGCVLAVAFYSTLLFGGSLNHYDWASHHYGYFDWVRISLVDFGTLPLFMNDAWITKNFLANAESPSLGLLVPLLWFLPTGAYIKLLFVVFTAAGFAGTVWLLRDVGVRREIAAFAGVVFAFQGFFVSHLCVGHPWAMGGLLLPMLLALYRRAALGSTRALWGAAALNALTIFGGQHQPFIWQNLMLSMIAVVWALSVRAWFPVVRFALVVAATIALGAVKILPLWAEFADYAPTARVPGMPPSLLVASLVASGQNPGFVAPGLDYRHGAGWWEYAFYLGPVAFACVAVGLVWARRFRALWVVAGIFTLLSLEWALSPWPWLEELPVWRTQRGPSRLLFPAISLSIWISALGLQRLWDRTHPRWPRGVPSAALVLLAGAGLGLYTASLPWQRAALGEPLGSADHRPLPIQLEVSGESGRPGDGTVELVAFAPNRLVYRARVAQPGRVVFPFRWGKGAPEWRIDGLPAENERGKLALDLPAGERDLVMTYRPKYFLLGAAISGITLVGVGTLALLRRPARSSGSRDRVVA